MVERSASGAAHLIEDAVEHLAPLLVLVEALIEEVPQKTAALRDAPADGVTEARHRVVRGRVVLHEADQIARAGQADADHPGIGAAIDNVVDAAGLEAAVEGDGAAVDEVPARARDDLTLRGRIVAHRHRVVGTVRIQHRIGLVRAIGDRCGVGALVEDEVAANEAGDPLAVIRGPSTGLGTSLRISKAGDRHLHPHRARAFRHVPLPSHPEQGEALTHEGAVAELRFLRRIRRAGGLLERLQQRLPAAVADLVEQPAVAAVRIDRFQQVEIGARLDLASRVARRQPQIDDVVIARQLGIEAEVDLADQLLVRPRRAERAAVENQLPPLDAQPHHPGFGDRRYERAHHRRDQDLTHSAPHTVSPHSRSRLTAEPAFGWASAGHAETPHHARRGCCDSTSGGAAEPRLSTEPAGAGRRRLNPRIREQPPLIRRPLPLLLLRVFVSSCLRGRRFVASRSTALSIASTAASASRRHWRSPSSPDGSAARSFPFSRS